MIIFRAYKMNYNFLVFSFLSDLFHQRTWFRPLHPVRSWQQKYTKFPKFGVWLKSTVKVGKYCRFLAMILLTMIARVADGLPLAASIQEDEQVSMKASFQQKLLKIRWCALTLRWLGATHGVVTWVCFVYHQKRNTDVAHLYFNDL